MTAITSELQLELREKYVSFVRSVLKDLGCFERPAGSESLLWHYTNGKGLLGIVQSGTLLATHISCLNDCGEMKYASDLFKTALRKLRETSSTSDQVLVDAAMNYFVTDENYTTRVPYFVSCFTDAEDSVFQWQHYVKEKLGYSIGFTAIGLDQMNATLVRVNYDHKVHEEMAKKLAQATLDFYKEGVAAGWGETVEEWGNVFIALWNEQITHVAPCVKASDWFHEQEYRLVRLLFVGQLQEIQVTQSDNMTKRCLPLRWNTGLHHLMLPIGRVILGKAEHADISSVSVDTLLRQHGYVEKMGEKMVTISKAPLRM